MNKDQQIAWQVAFKGAIELVANGVAEPETEDIAAEIASLADSLYEQAQERLGGAATGGGSGKAQRPSRKRSTTSRKGGSYGGGDFKFASDKQAAFVERLLDEKAHDVEYEESSFVWDGADVSFDAIPAGKTQEIIEYLLAFDDA